MAGKEFPGTPAFYRKLAVALGIYATGSVYLVFSLVEYLLNSETWVFESKMVWTVAALFVGFALLAYFCFMQLDGQFLDDRAMESYRKKNIIPFP